MATEVEVPQKIYCCGDRQQYDPMAMIAMMNGGGFGNGFNNPLSYILVMWMMRYMRENGMCNGDDYNSRTLAQLQNTVDSNHNNQVILDAMSNNQAAIRELAQVFNTDINVVQQGICAIKSAIETVGGVRLVIQSNLSRMQLLWATSQSSSNSVIAAAQQKLQSMTPQARSSVKSSTRATSLSWE